MICVYSPECTDFSSNGHGPVEPLSATVTETLNGEYELTLVHPIDENGKWRRLVEGCILRAPVPAGTTPQVDLILQPGAETQIYKVATAQDRLHLRSGTGTNHKILGKYKKGTEVIVLAKTTSEWYEVTCPDGKHGYMYAQYLAYVRTESQPAQAINGVVESRQLRDQPFRIYRVVPDLNRITVYARHIFYDLLDNMVKSYKPSSETVGASVVQGISESCESEHDFTFFSDLDCTAENAEFTNVNPVEALLGEGGAAEKYSGELQRDWFDVFMVKRVGRDKDVQIRQGKNLLGISYDVDLTNVTTRIMPTGEDENGELLYLPELYIDSQHIDSYVKPKWLHLPVADAKEVTKGDEKKTKEECYAEMRKAVQAAYDSGCDLPTVTLKVDFINCADTVEYSQYKALQNIFLGDSVRVIARRIGVEVSMRMTQYTYDCLTRKYTEMTLGTVADTVEGNIISARQLPGGIITGAKLAINSVGSGQLQSGSVGALQIQMAAIQSAHIQNAAIQSAHIQDASITKAHIAEALISVLNVNALNAVTARINELAAGNITTDELYASIAMISAAQLTTANIVRANIDWAQIETLAAEIATISKAQITSANIDEANIDWAAITTLSAAVATMVKADIGTADIDWAHIKDLTTDTAIITQGVGGQLYIARLAVTEANMVSLTVGELVVKGKDGHFYAVGVDADGEVVTTLKQVVNDDVADLSINGGEKIIEGSITAGTLNVQNIFGDNAVIRSLIAANLDVDTLFAREATITALNNYILRTQTIEAIEGKLEIWANNKITLAVDNIRIGGRNLLRNTGILKISNYGFDASGADTQGSCSEDENGGFHIVCSNANVRWWPGVQPVTPGQAYAMSIHYKMNSGSAPIQFQYVFRNAAGSVVAYNDSNNIGTASTATEDGWNVLKSEFTVPSNAAITSVNIAVRTGKDYALYTCDYNIRRPKFEAGSKATDWTPAPEDAEKAIDELSAELAVQAGTISANTSRIETVNQTAANAQNTANSAKNTASTNAANLNAVTKRVTTAEANISALDGKISTKVEKSEFDALGNKVSQNTASITQTANAIRSEVANSVSGLQTQIDQTDGQVTILAGRTVGGTNLVRVGEGTVTTLSGVVARNWEKSAWCQSCTGIVLYTFTSSYNGAHFYTDVKVVPGQYTLSFWCWTYGTNIQPVLRCNLFSSADGVDHYFKDIQTTANTPVRYEIPISVTYSATVNLRMLTWSKWTAGELYISDVKLESGNTATAWSPHPEEFRAGSSVEITENRVKIASRETLIAIPSADGETTVAQFDENGLTASQVSAGNIAYRYDGAAGLYVDVNATSAQIAAGNYYRSMADACAALSGRHLNMDVNIYIMSDHYSVATLCGICGTGGITIYGNSHTLTGRLRAYRNTVDIIVTKLNVTADGNIAVDQYGPGWMQWSSCTFIGNKASGSYGLTLVRKASAFLHNCSFYNAEHLLGVATSSDVVCNTLRGGGGTNFLYSDGGNVKWYGSRPDGILRTDHPSLYSPADLSSLTIDYGTAQPSTPVISTVTYAMTNSDSYCGGWSRYDDADVRQGYANDHRIYGTIWFNASAIRSALSGKTINQVSLRLFMQSGYGRGVAVSVQLYGSNTAYSGRSGAPGIAASYGTIGSTNPGELNEITLPTQVITDIVNGAIQALVLLSDDTELYKDRSYSRNYARFDGETSGTDATKPLLTVTYQS